MNIFQLNPDFPQIIAGIILGFITGALISLSYIYCGRGKTISKNFSITVLVIPVIVSVIIHLIGSDIAKAISLGGIFALVRFRSIPGNSKDICYIFFAMAVGLAIGINYYIVGIILTLVVGLVFILSKILEQKDKHKNEFNLKIMVPEDMSFHDAFDTILNKYCTSYKNEEIKTTNMGTVYTIVYNVFLKDKKDAKDFIDELRVKNGNLSIVLSTFDKKPEML